VREWGGVLFTDNQALAWLFRNAKEFGRIGRWILLLAPFKRRTTHISGQANVVADCLTTQHEKPFDETTFSGLILGQLPEAFKWIAEYQKDPV
jgi:hypothetical protein